MAKTPYINASALTALHEITLAAEPNQRFNVNLDGAEWEFTIQTFLDNSTRISITKDGEGVCNCAPLTPFKNLTFLSSHEGGMFFFGATTRIETPTYEMLGNTLRLYYGYF